MCLLVASSKITFWNWSLQWQRESWELNPAPLKCHKHFKSVPHVTDKMQVEQGEVHRFIAVDIRIRLALCHSSYDTKTVTSGSDPVLKDPDVGLGVSHNDGPHLVL